jgi:hypothetical protein
MKSGFVQQMRLRGGLSAGMRERSGVLLVLVLGVLVH